MSTLRVNTIQNSGGTGSPEINGLARAWVNFNGTGTVAIRGSNNVTSITDNGTGDYSVNFTTAITDSNYAVAGITSGQTTTVDANGLRTSEIYANYVRVRAVTGNASAYVDVPAVCVAIFR